jgi:hypothetical protein
MTMPGFARFHDITITADGKRYSQRQHEIDKLEPKAVDVFTTMIANAGRGFKVKPIDDRFPGFALTWATTTVPGAAFATFFYNKDAVTSCVLLAGLDPKERKLLELAWCELQKGWGALLAVSEEMLSIPERPVIVCCPAFDFMVHGPEPLMLVADMETCLAAAFFKGQ